MLPVDPNTRALVKGGMERVALNESHLPSHNHVIRSATSTLADVLALSVSLLPGPNALLSSKNI